MAAASGLSQPTVGRIWRAFGLKPHRAGTFKLSTDPYFVEKVRDVVGLSPPPPENAIVLRVDERPQARALERTQPVLPTCGTRQTASGSGSRRASGRTASGATSSRLRTASRARSSPRTRDRSCGPGSRRATIEVKDVEDLERRLVPTIA